MEWQFVVALVLVIPIILLPIAFIWYLNLGGLFSRIKELRARRTAPRKSAEVSVEIDSVK